MLAPAASSLTQFVLSTVPFLMLMTYFLILAFQRPEIYDKGDELGMTLIPLTHMIYVNLTFYGLWSLLFMYLKVFVPRRRQLTETYVYNNNEIILGDVKYDDARGQCGFLGNLIAKCRNVDYAYVTYRHRGDGFVEKHVRTYLPFDRENVAIILLPNSPLSGQPRGDLQRDAATFPKDRDRSRPMLVVCASWLLFVLLGSLYITHQLYNINDPDLERWNGNQALVWTTSTFVLFPILAYVANLFRFKRYRKWVTDSGEIVSHISAKALIDKEAYKTPYEDPDICDCRNNSAPQCSFGVIS
jgi:hypothetical protein